MSALAGALGGAFKTPKNKEFCISLCIVQD